MLPANLLLGAAVVALAVGILVVGAGGASWLGGALGDAVGGLVGRITATPEPSPTPLPILDPPSLRAPINPYTNQPTVTLSGSIPADLAGDPDVTVRIDVAAGGGPPTEVKEIAVPSSATFTVAEVPLVEGPNDFTATLVVPGAQSEPSPVATYVLDTQPPEITIRSPADGATVNRALVEITGLTQELSDVVARNEANGAMAEATAEGDGSFTIAVPIVAGINGITVNVTDPAGNPGSAVVSVRMGSGKLAASITASSYRISVGSLPEPLTVRVAVTDPDGAPLAGAQVLFSLTLPGIPAIVPEVTTTDASGTAAFRTVIPTGATPGSGMITALVTSQRDGEVTAQRGILVVK